LFHEEWWHTSLTDIIAQRGTLSSAMRPVFADPKTDFVFERLFGSVRHKKLLNALFELKGDHTITAVRFFVERRAPRATE
jgi:hypothetical protein